jgi:hypothetical protein
LLAFGVLIFAGLNLVRFILALQQWGFLSGLLPISPVYLAASGLIWFLVGLVLFWGLWRGERWAPVFTRWASFAYLVYYWGDRLFLSDQAAIHVNRPFAVGLSLIIVVVILWILSGRKAKRFFG